MQGAERQSGQLPRLLRVLAHTLSSPCGANGVQKMMMEVQGGGLELKGPWPTHSGILMQLPASPCAVLLPQVFVPAAIPTACDHSASRSWATCLARARADLEARPLFAEAALRQRVSTHAWPELCVTLEIFYRLWLG